VPSRAIAKNTRDPASTFAEMAPNVEHRIAASYAKSVEIIATPTPASSPAVKWSGNAGLKCHAVPS
jgi:hypothetical protein